MVAPGAPQQPLTFNDVFEDEEVDEPKPTNTVHHIRANSSIMHVKKILGESQWSSLSSWVIDPSSIGSKEDALTRLSPRDSRQPW